MSSLTETVVFIFGLVALGYLAGLTGYLSNNSGAAIAEFAVNVAMPLLLFRTMTEVDFHGAAPLTLWSVYFAAAAVTWTIGHFIVTRLFGRDSRAGVVGGVSSAFSNLVLLGIPFVSGVFGKPGVEVLSLLVSVHLPIMMMASVILFEMFGRSDGDGEVDALRVLRSFLRKIFANPLIIGILAGLAWRFSGVPLSGICARLVDALGGAAGPVALFSIGLGLRRFGISGNLRPALLLSILKLGLMPGLVLVFAWFLGLPPLTAKVAVAAAAMPCGVNAYLIAAQFGTGQALASNQLTLSTICAVASTTLWIAAAGLVWPIA
jgi:predicted permease